MKNKLYILFPFLLGLIYGVGIFSVWWVFRLGRHLPDIVDNLIVISAHLAPIVGGIISFYRLCKCSCCKEDKN
ncbi:hypothetical protein K1720_01540 [Thermococcus argininiproducens]|uniref:Uncharacterized protein n=1 Tax=Thermococcus argininiproducens TaxID=2866384 RepID=A0A9E7MBH5_9EURY|nr:hypothetical protein [Thermococcus argininiproducens]USH00188.1 hypothetical protein K1720_01540 [Thermococcus argininiproducens]